MLDDTEFFSNIEKMDAAYYSAKDLFAGNDPYRRVNRLSGPAVVMDKHFTDNALEAFSTDCLNKLSQSEADFLLHFIDWQNFLLSDPVNPIVAGSAEDTYVSVERDALEAFNNWLVDEIAETAHPASC